MNLVRTGSAALVGIGSGVLDNRIVPSPINLGGLAVGYDMVFEVGSLVAGVGLQALMPMTLPNLADGLVDGGIALTARRLTVYGVQALTGKTPVLTGYRPAMPYRVNGAMYGGVHGGTPRGATTTLTGLSRARAH